MIDFARSVVTEKIQREQAATPLHSTNVDANATAVLAKASEKPAFPHGLKIRWLAAGSERSLSTSPLLISLFRWPGGW